MGSAKALPVRRIPEQRLITAVRYDVIDHCGHTNDSIGLAHHAEWMLLQVQRPSLSPFVVIASLS
jgi:hypothetical protein